VKGSTFAFVLSASLLLVFAGVLYRGAAVPDARADVSASGEELSPYMAHQQELSQKLGLAIQSKNKPLADFYLNELTEGFDVIQKKFPTYDGVQVAALSKAMIDPAVAPLKKALTGADWTTATSTYGTLVTSCNNCHIASKHEFIKITVPTGNPFNQSFATQ
jgi:hypothetical protein